MHDNWVPELFRLERAGMWVKLRPGLRDFLRRCHDKFELWAHTDGTRAHAGAMLDLVDPNGSLFASRIIADGETSEPFASASKRIQAGLSGRESVTIALDDSAALWPLDKRHLFAVERYLFFPSSRKRFGMKGKSLLEINRSVVDDNGCPAHALLRITSLLNPRPITQGRVP